MIEIIIVWILTLITLSLGGVIGYLIGSKKLEQKIETQRLLWNRKLNPPTESGAIKPYTKEEKKELDNTAEKRFKELL